MTEGAVVRDFLLAVAIHARAHGHVFFFCHDREGFHVAVAIGTPGTGVGVGFMAPVNEGGELINTHPGDAFPAGEKFGELLNFFGIRLDRLMAGHAFRFSRKGHHLAGRGTDVAGLALEIEIASVLFVTECDWLPGRFSGPIDDWNQSEEKELHRLPFFL